MTEDTSPQRSALIFRLIGSVAFVLVSMATLPAQSRGRALGLASMEVDVQVGSVESEITATLQFLPRPAAVSKSRYDLFIPVYVPQALAKDSSSLKKFKPALSVERRPVILSIAEPPQAVARIDTISGMSIIWWKAMLRWPRRGEPLIVDLRYIQRNAVSQRMRSSIFVPIAPDGPLTEGSVVRLHTDTPGTALYLRSGSIKKSGPFAKWTGKGKTVGKSLSCSVRHQLPIVVDLVAEK
ncbi:MAG: hypothetical protein ACI9R3_004347 [Verrucomicrobiales bacterium]|jgi:hypothetical protein